MTKTDRMGKVNQQIKREISTIIQQELSDPRIEFVTVTSVEVSRDLKIAKVYFSVLGDEKLLDSALKGLTSARGIIRKYVGQRIKMRYTPEIHFHLDPTIEYSARIEETLQEINDESQKNRNDDQET